jgi:hypothetical protein
VLRIEAQQHQLGIVLAVEPGGDERVPQAVDDLAILVHRQAAVDAGEQLMALGAEGGDRAAAAGQVVDHGVGFADEEPDRPVLALDHRRHRARVAILHAVQAQHHGAVGGEGVPEFLFEGLLGAHVTLLRDGRGGGRNVLGGGP